MMKINKNMIIALTITFCFIASLFMVIPIRSQSSGQYDPWLDINDDGRINMDEIVASTTAFGATGDPTKNVNVTNFPLDEYGNLRVSGFEESLQSRTLSQKITVFTTEPIWTYPYDCYMGGVKLNSNSEFVFDFNPSGTPFNITSIRILAIIFADRGSTTYELEPTRGWITINNQTEQITTNASVWVDINYLTALSIPVSNSTLINSIHEGTNTLQMVIQSYRPDAYSWIDDCAYEISLFVDYECLA